MHIVQNHHFSVPKTVRYATLGPPIADAKHIMVALHGYGQLPEFFLRKFAALAEDGWCVIAPEGMHRFYLDGTSGRVGASWMTREDRETDIADYVHYLDALCAHLELNHRHPVLLGFSQGVATASRWVAAGQQNFKQLILWAGVFPPDFEWTTGRAHLSQMLVDVALGDNDPFFKDELLQSTSDLLDSRQVTYNLHRFSGGHAIDPRLLRSIVAPS